MLLLAIAKQVRWSSYTLSHEFRYPFMQSWRAILSTINGLYFSQLETDGLAGYVQRFDWMPDARAFVIDNMP